MSFSRRPTGFGEGRSKLGEKTGRRQNAGIQGTPEVEAILRGDVPPRNKLESVAAQIHERVNRGSQNQETTQPAQGKAAVKVGNVQVVVKQPKSTAMAAALKRDFSAESV